MESTSYPEVLPAPDGRREVAEDLERHAGPRVRTERQGLTFGGWVGRFLLRTLARLWSWLIAAVLSLNYFTSIVLVGWAYRWMARGVVKRWWKKSPVARQQSFEEWCQSLDAKDAVPAPRWRNVWTNFKTGVSGLFCTYLVLGWGSLLMLGGWEFGWLNSFHKGYELSAVGILTSLTGIALFIAGLFYVPMAQVHQAVAGTRQSFFDFHLIWRLIQARTGIYLWLFIVLFIAALPVEFMKLRILDPNFIGHDDALSDGEVLRGFYAYLFGCALFFIPIYLLVRFVAYRIYSGAVLKTLRAGTVARSELPPQVVMWLESLQMMPVPLASRNGFLQVAGKTARWSFRKAVFIVMFLVCFGLVFQLYVREFLVYHPISGFLNHELIQFPSVDFVPIRLWVDALQG